MFYEIFRINPIKDGDFNLVPLKEKLFLSTISNNITYFEGPNYYIYKIFEICFCVKWADSKKDLKSVNVPEIAPFKETFHYYAFCCDTPLEDREVSQNIRGTNTLILTNDNTITNEYKTVVIDKKGFGVFCEKQQFNNVKQYFLWTLDCVLLALAYNYSADDFTKKTIELYKLENKTKKLIEHRKNMFAFAIENYCHYPIAEGRYFVYEIWEKVSAILNVQNIHEEMKFQIQDIVNAIETEQNNTMIKNYNKRTIVLAFFGTIFTIIGALHLF